MTCSNAATALLLSACLLPLACSGPRSEMPSSPSEPTVPTMHSSNDATAARSIPPIDAAAPAAYQTATFALG